ncbi:MAG: MarR family transcriptional regulator [Salaquimonas sp.]|jgi:DNA-binding MarR family transcriptional regulator|nr:MarR family transcriptional regulator [Salaquimonas sp.]
MDQRAIQAEGDDGSETRDVELGGLANSLGFMLRLAQIRAFDEYFREFADLGLPPGTISVLTIIAANPGIRQGMLARRLRIKPANMTKTVRTLEGEGIVERHVPDDDRRALELRLSAKGRAAVAQFLDRTNRHEMESFGPLDLAEREELMRLLTKYVGLKPGGTP